MNRLRSVHVFATSRSQSSNSFIGKTPDCKRSCTAQFTSWVCEYGLPPMRATSWQRSRRRKSDSGTSFAPNGARNTLSLSHIVVPVGLPYDVSSCDKIICTLIVGFHPFRLGSLDTLKLLSMLSSSIRNNALLMFR